MNWTRGFILALSLSLAFTLGLLLRPHPASLDPGDDYAVDAAVARKVSRVLDAEGPMGGAFTRVAAALRPCTVSIQGTGSQGDSTGTGVILDTDGHVLTNLHVVEGLEAAVVSLSSGDRYRASLVGADEATDLAVLKIPASDVLLPIRFHEDDSLLVGQQVLAIGNAFGFGWSVSQGIISSLHRSGFSGRGYTDYIQTDAAINPGNSGGPLVDTRGRCIGINSVIVSKTGGSAGIGFALPAADARFVADQLIRTGRVERGFLGVRGRALATFSREDRRSMGATGARGIVVTYVRAGSPAETVLRRGDVILEMDGVEVESYDTLRARVARSEPGSEVAFRVLRSGEHLTLDVTVGRRPADS